MPVPCTHIEGPDLTKWRDRNCHKHSKYSHESNHVPISYKNKDTYYGTNSETVSDFSTFFDNLLSKPSAEDQGYVSM